MKQKAKPSSPQETDFEATHRDEYAGQGGSYEIDPATGKRRLIENTLSPEEAAKRQAAASKPV